MKYFLSIGFALLAGIACAKEEYPAGCNPMQIKGELASLPTKAAALVMVHNLSKMDVWITHTATDPGASGGWSSQLRAGHWSTLALDKGKAPFALSCVESKPGHEQLIPCSDVLAVCMWEKFSLPEQATGNFWAGEDMTLSALMAYIRRHGLMVAESSL